MKKQILLITLALLGITSCNNVSIGPAIKVKEGMDSSEVEEVLDDEDTYVECVGFGCYRYKNRSVVFTYDRDDHKVNKVATFPYKKGDIDDFFSIVLYVDDVFDVTRKVGIPSFIFGSGVIRVAYVSNGKMYAIQFEKYYYNNQTPTPIQLGVRLDDTGNSL